VVVVATNECEPHLLSCVFVDIYRAVVKWTKVPKQRLFCYSLMAMMLGVFPSTIRDRYADAFVKSITSSQVCTLATLPHSSLRE